MNRIQMEILGASSFLANNGVGANAAGFSWALPRREGNESPRRGGAKPESSSGGYGNSWRRRPRSRPVFEKRAAQHGEKRSEGCPAPLGSSAARVGHPTAAPALQRGRRGEQNPRDVPPRRAAAQPELRTEATARLFSSARWLGGSVNGKNPFPPKWGFDSSSTGPRLMGLKERIKFPLAHWSTESFTCQGMRNPSYSFVGICTVMLFWYETGCKYARLPNFTTEILLISLNGAYFPKWEPYDCYSMSRNNQILPWLHSTEWHCSGKKHCNVSN